MGVEGRRVRRRDVLDRFGVTWPGLGEDPQRSTALVSQELLVVARLLLIPVIVVGGLVATDVQALFWVIAVLRCAWLAAGVLAARRGLLESHPRLFTPAVDLALTAGLLLTSGGSDSPLRYVIVGLPVAGGYLMAPGMVGVLGAGAALATLAAALPDLLGREDGSPERVVLTLLAVAYSTAVGVAFAWGRTLLTRKAAEADAGRRRLLSEGLSAEDRERRRVSHDLHGEALQVLLSAAQDLDEEDPDALRRARAGIRTGVAALRETVRDLHPAALRHAGLEAALRAALEHRVRHVLSVGVAPGGDGEREALLLSVVRDLGDALAQAGADDAVAARVSTEPRFVVLALSAGYPGGSVEQLRAALAGVQERVEADSGSLQAEVGLDGRVALCLRLARDTAAADRAGGLDDPEDIRRRAQLISAGLWLLMAPFGVAISAIDGSPGRLFLVLVALAAAYHGAVLVATLTEAWGKVWSSAGTAATLVACGAAVPAQGGIATWLPALAIVVPFLLVLTFRPLAAGGLALVLAATLAVGAAPSVAAGDPGARAATAILGATYAWAASTALLIGTGRERMRHRLAGLAQARRRIMHDSLGVADAERQRLSMRLHDGALQELMIAGQDLDQAIDGDADSLGPARTALLAGLAQLRDIVADLHPPALEHGGLRPALRAVLDRACARGTLAAAADVDPAADGLRDELVVSLVRELVTNVSKHARADRVDVRVTRLGDVLELEVADDGVGMRPDRLPAALAEGHIGLASARERVEADGGELLVDAAPGEGTRVTVRLPLAPSGALA